MVIAASIGDVQNMTTQTPAMVTIDMTTSIRPKARKSQRRSVSWLMRDTSWPVGFLVK